MIRGIDILLLTPYVFIPALGFTLARAVGKWWTLVPATALSVLYWIGLDNYWWGYGTGDGWQFLMILTVLMTAAAVGLGLLFRHLRTRQVRP